MSTFRTRGLGEVFAPGHRQWTCQVGEQRLPRDVDQRNEAGLKERSDVLGFLLMFLASGIEIRLKYICNQWTWGTWVFGRNIGPVLWMFLLLNFGTDLSIIPIITLWKWLTQLCKDYFPIMNSYSIYIVDDISECFPTRKLPTTYTTIFPYVSVCHYLFCVVLHVTLLPQDASRRAGGLNGV